MDPNLDFYDASFWFQFLIPVMEFSWDHVGAVIYGSSFSFLVEFPWDPNVWCIASVGQTNHNPYIIASVGQTNPTQWYVGRAQRTNFMKICLARFSHRAFYISLEGLCFFFFSIIQNAYLEYLYEYHCFRNGNCIVLDMYLDLAEDLSSRPEFGTS